MSQSKAAQVAAAQQFIAAFTKYFGKKTKFTVLETEYTLAQVTSMVQGRVDTQTDVVTTRGTYSKALATAKATEAQTNPVYEGFKQVVLASYASNPAILSEFGMAAKKKAGPKTVAAKQAAILQTQATRAARHTMGSRQKAKVKGVVATASSGAAVSTPSVAPTATNDAGSNPVAAVASAGSNPVVAGVVSSVTPALVTGH